MTAVLDWMVPPLIAFYHQKYFIIRSHTYIKSCNYEVHDYKFITSAYYEPHIKNGVHDHFYNYYLYLQLVFYSWELGVKG